MLATNVGAVLLHSVLHQYHRGLYCIGHMYIGVGQHVVLRISLGCIETASSLFRAVSLSLRVVCNATAGHVLLAVLIEMTVSSYISPLLHMLSPLHIDPSVTLSTKYPMHLGNYY